jgi:hypothetical protein
MLRKEEKKGESKGRKNGRWRRIVVKERQQGGEVDRKERWGRKEWLKEGIRGRETFAEGKRWGGRNGDKGKETMAEGG